MEKYETLERELIEMLSKSFTFNDLEQIGKDLFGRKYNTHELEGISKTLSISPTNAARRLVSECSERKKIETLVITLVQMEGNYLNDKIVKIRNLENLLYHQAQYGIVYDYKQRKFLAVKSDPTLVTNWGVLRDKKDYTLTVGSVDICKNSMLVKKHGSSTMETVYKRLLEFIRTTLYPYDGRVWSWQGDGGLIAFPKKQKVDLSISCCMNILLTLPVFNLHPDHPIADPIQLRIGVDRGTINFFADTGRIVSETINYAAHLEKSNTDPWGISISDSVYKEINPKIRKHFATKAKFEGRTAYKMIPLNSLSPTAKRTTASATKKAAK